MARVKKTVNKSTCEKCETYFLTVNLITCQKNQFLFLIHKLNTHLRHLNIYINSTTYNLLVLSL